MILAYDPGVTTGWAFYRDGVYETGQIDSKVLVNIFTHIGYYATQSTSIGYEDFKHRPQLIHSELYSLQVIGVIRLWCQDNSVTPFFMLPARAKAFWTDDKIKAMSLWDAGKPHAMDALRVLLTWRQKNEPAWFGEVAECLRK